MKGFLLLMLVFYIITLVILYIYIYIQISKNIEGPKEKERDREREGEREREMWLWLGAYDLNLSTTPSKLDTMFQQQLGFLKSMFRGDIELLYVIFVFIYIFGKCLIFVND